MFSFSALLLGLDDGWSKLERLLTSTCTEPALF